MNLASIFQNSKDARDYPAGTTIFEEGEPSDAMYVVLAGELDPSISPREEFILHRRCQTKSFLSARLFSLVRRRDSLAQRICWRLTTASQRLVVVAPSDLGSDVRDGAVSALRILSGCAAH
jgi:hypothetical protein